MSIMSRRNAVLGRHRVHPGLGIDKVAEEAVGVRMTTVLATMNDTMRSTMAITILVGSLIH